jgi:hypothetical protein
VGNFGVLLCGILRYFRMGAASGLYCVLRVGFGCEQREPCLLDLATAWQRDQIWVAGSNHDRTATKKRSHRKTAWAKLKNQRHAPCSGNASFLQGWFTCVSEAISKSGRRSSAHRTKDMFTFCLETDGAFFWK